MPIYTKTGDDGQTGLFGNRRVPKDDARIEAYGTVDELNSVLGMLRAEYPDRPSPTDAQIQSIQETLFEIGADLATEGGNASVPRVEKAIKQLEQWIDATEATLPKLKSFVLPGGSKVGGLLHLARTVTRRTERCYWTLQRSVEANQPVPKEIGIYLNRLSDLCFSWARRANQEANVEDIPWKRGD